MVEIQHGRPIVEQVGIQEARGFVGFLAARRIPEHEIEALRPRRERTQPERLPAQAELDDPLALVLVELAERVQHLDRLRLRVLDEAADDAVLQVDREPAEAEESLRLRAIRIAHAQRLGLAADVDDEADITDDQLVGFRRPVIAQFDWLSDPLTVQDDRSICRRFEADSLIVS